MNFIANRNDLPLEKKFKLQSQLNLIDQVQEIETVKNLYRELIALHIVQEENLKKALLRNL